MTGHVSVSAVGIITAPFFVVASLSSDFLYAAGKKSKQGREAAHGTGSIGVPRLAHRGGFDLAAFSDGEDEKTFTPAWETASPSGDEPSAQSKNNMNVVSPRGFWQR